MEGVYTFAQYEHALKNMSMITFSGRPPRARVFVEARPDGTGLVTTICSADEMHKPVIPNLAVAYDWENHQHRTVKYVDVTDADEPVMHEMLQQTITFTYKPCNIPPEYIPTRFAVRDHAVIVFNASVQNPEYIRSQFISLHEADIDREDVPQQLGFSLDPEHPPLLVAITQPTMFEASNVPQNLPKYFEWSMPLRKHREAEPRRKAQPLARKGRCRAVKRGRPAKNPPTTQKDAAVKNKDTKQSGSVLWPPQQTQQSPPENGDDGEEEEEEDMEDNEYRDPSYIE